VRRRLRTLRDVGEHGWIAEVVRRLAAGPTPPGVLVGAGDDAAVIRAGRRPLVLTTDTLREGVHFRAGWLTPAALGRRAFGVNASDVAAMGALPRYALLALEAPGRTTVTTLHALVGGFTAAARRAGACVVGGNLSAGPGLAITATLVGELPGRMATRAGARPGDGLYLTGALGAAGVAVRRLARGEPARLPEPPLRARVGVVLARAAHAMIDVSDGLVQDLGHVCRASRVAAEVELARLPLAPACRRALGPAAPVFAATAGEDYELLVALPPSRGVSAIAHLRTRLGCPLTLIGRVVAGAPAVRLVDAGGRRVRGVRRGFDHFRRARPALIVGEHADEYDAGRDRSRRRAR
jgi:thiamine-monophosphate kinase